MTNKGIRTLRVPYEIPQKIDINIFITLLLKDYQILNQFIIMANKQNMLIKSSIKLYS